MKTESSLPPKKKRLESLGALRPATVTIITTRVCLHPTVMAVLQTTSSSLAYVSVDFLIREDVTATMSSDLQNLKLRLWQEQERMQ